MSMTDCQEHVGTRTRQGYGMLYYEHRQWLAHRLAWTLANGPIPNGLCVLHRCDNPPCVNPAHLWLGTKADNAADRDRKGRTARGPRNGARRHPERLARGERHGLVRLTEQGVREMRSLRRQGWTYARLAERFGVHRSVATDATVGRTWSHV